MSYQIKYDIRWETALKEGLVWACIACFASWVIFLILCCLNAACGVELLLVGYLYYPAKIIADYLCSRRILSNENVMGFLLIAVSAPWMITGFMFGACRGFFFRPSSMSEKDGCLKASFYIVLATIIGVVLIFLL